jgi:hypothetical protein
MSQSIETHSPTPTRAQGTPGADAEASKDDSQLRQKEMLARHFDLLAAAPETGRKVAYTFVPGNLTELLLALDLLPVLPEINALQSGMRKRSGQYILEAEKLGHSEDVCTYVKCDIGMMKGGNIGPTGQKLPSPDVLLLSYTGCFTFMKWFEILKQEYKCPVTMLHVPYQPDGHITPDMRAYVVSQLEREVIPALEKVGRKEARHATARRAAGALSQGRRRPRGRVGERHERALAHRRLLRRRLLHRAHLLGLPRHPGGRRLLRELRREVEARVD